MWGETGYNGLHLYSRLWGTIKMVGPTFWLKEAPVASSDSNFGSVSLLSGRALITIRPQAGAIKTRLLNLPAAWHHQGSWAYPGDLWQS